MNDDAWYPCVFEVGTPPGKIMAGGPLLSNVDDTDTQIIFRLPLPIKKGNMSLHVAGVQIGLLGADPMNFVSQISVNGMTHLAMKVFFEATDDLTAQQLKTYQFPAHNCGGYEAVLARVWSSVSAPSKLHITSVALHCYYA